MSKGLRWALGLLIALLVLATVVYVGLLVRWPVEKTLAYWLIDGQTLGVVVLDAPDLTCDVARVDEASDAVRIHAQCQERVIPVPQPAMVQQYVFEVALHESLGARTVYDGSGNLAESCKRPAPDCFPTK
jgi:hypothetical protein